MKAAGKALRITVKHEPQPPGLRIFVVPRRDTEPLGLSITGGIDSSPINPHDRTDAGIFIERIEKGGSADQANSVSTVEPLTVGTRILEVIFELIKQFN